MFQVFYDFLFGCLYLLVYMLLPCPQLFLKLGGRIIANILAEG